MEKHGDCAVLIDSSVLFHAVSHETAWVSSGSAKWGNEVEVDTGYATRVPVHAEDCKADVYSHIQFLPGIAQLARLGALNLKTSAELKAEQLRQPIGRFQGYGYGDLNLFSGIEMKSVDGYQYDLGGAKKKQLDRVNACNDPLFRQLIRVLGIKNSLDAYHIHTAERNGCYCFLHLDLKLNRLIEQHSNNPDWPKLRTKVLLPADLGAVLKLRPMSPRLLSFEEDTLSSRPDLFVPGQLRRRPNNKRK